MKRERNFVCLCLDITDADLDRAIAEGFDESELVKRYTGTFMGPCQGKSCMDTVLEAVARKTGVPVEDVRRPTLRPPAFPVRMSTMAAFKPSAAHDVAEECS